MVITTIFNGRCRSLKDFFIPDFAAYALIATLFTWAMTALGAALVFFFKAVNRGIFNMLLGFASGVMTAASFWSLLAPAERLARESPSLLPPWAAVSLSFVLGAALLLVCDRVIPKLGVCSHISSSRRRCAMLVYSITLHNIPEGLAVGVAFASAAEQGSCGAFMGAAAVAFGIGLQNFPEGAAVSLPLRRDGMRPMLSFLYGQASGAVEPIAGLLGALLVGIARPVLPYALAFAAGAMIYVSSAELIPEAQCCDKKSNRLSMPGLILGFGLMTALDVALK